MLIPLLLSTSSMEDISSSLVAFFLVVQGIELARVVSSAFHSVSRDIFLSMNLFSDAFLKC